MSYSLESLKKAIKGTTVGDIKGDFRVLDYGSHADRDSCPASFSGSGGQGFRVVDVSFRITRVVLLSCLRYALYPRQFAGRCF